MCRQRKPPALLPRPTPHGMALEWSILLDLNNRMVKVLGLSPLNQEGTVRIGIFRWQGSKWSCSMDHTWDIGCTKEGSAPTICGGYCGCLSTSMKTARLGSRSLKSASFNQLKIERHWPRRIFKSSYTLLDLKIIENRPITSYLCAEIDWPNIRYSSHFKPRILKDQDLLTSLPASSEAHAHKLARAALNSRML